MMPSASTHPPTTVAALPIRAGTYLLFARLFREAPTAELLREIVQQRLLSNADPRWPQQAEAIAVEFARLFAVPGEQAVRPYESVYCDSLTIDMSTACSPYFESGPQPEGLTGFLHGPSTSSVSEVYRRAGFELDASLHELPDHLAIELEFMGQLLARGAQDHARDFFTQHLGRPARQGNQEAGGWVFHCVDEIRQEAHPTGFYRAVADALAAFLRQDQQPHA